MLREFWIFPLWFFSFTFLIPVWTSEAQTVFNFSTDWNKALVAGNRPQMEIEPTTGRYGGPALSVSAASEVQAATRVLFEEPQALYAPDRYRAEAWVNMTHGGCRLSLILLDRSAKTETRRFPLAGLGRPLPNGWEYVACDVPVPHATETPQYNIEIALSGGPVRVSDLKVTGLDSILGNGEFREREDLPGTEEMAIPRGWRRAFLSRDLGRQSEGTYQIEEKEGRNVLLVRKGAGEFVLSTPPLVAPATEGSLVVRLHTESATDQPPILEVSQVGTKGLLGESRTEQTTQYGEETVATTRPVEILPQTKRVHVRIRFPSPAGEYRVRAAKVSLLPSSARRIQILYDQVGYDTKQPLRFIAATDFFPTDAIGAFTLSSSGTLCHQGDLVALGRCVGQRESDWGSYSFEGRVPDPVPGTYVLTATLDGACATVGDVVVAPRARLVGTGELAYRFYSVQRCGCEVPGWHGPCHMDDGRLPDGRHVDVTGGFHSAGDFHKHFGDNAPISVYGMLSAYEKFKDFFDAIDRNGNGEPDVLDEARWGADWMLKMMNPETGHLWVNVTNNIEYYGTAENDTDGVVGTADDRSIGTADPGDLGAFPIASWAVLARCFPDSVYLQAAERVWSVYEERILAGCNPRHVFTTLELFETTKDPKYRAAADRVAESIFPLQNEDGWFATSPGGPPQFRLVDEGTTPAALAFYALHCPDSPLVERAKNSLQRYFDWSLRLADNPFGLIRNFTGGEPMFFNSRDDWFGGGNSEYSSTAWAAYLAATLFVESDPGLSRKLQAHATNQIYWILGRNPLNLCMFEGRGTSERIYFHHLYAEIPGRPRGAVPGAIPNGICREPHNTDRPWFDFRTGLGSLPAAESSEPWLPHNAYYLLMLSATE